MLNDRNLIYLSGGRLIERFPFISQQLNPDAPYHDASQAIALDRVAQLESIVAILRNQLLTTDDLFKKALLSKKTLEGANCDLLTVVDKLKIELTHSESRRKLTEEHNGRLDADNDALKNRLLEKETEVSSLRLTLAKIVRSTGYELSENELALLRGKTIASDFIKNVSLHNSQMPQMLIQYFSYPLPEVDQRHLLGWLLQVAEEQCRLLLGAFLAPGKCFQCPVRPLVARRARTPFPFAICASFSLTDTASPSESPPPPEAASCEQWPVFS